MTQSEKWQAVAEKIEPRPVVLGGDREWKIRPYDAEMCLMLLKRLEIGVISYGSAWLACEVPQHSSTFKPIAIASGDTPEEAILAAAYEVLCVSARRS